MILFFVLALAFTQRNVDNGIVVELSVQGRLQEGNDVTVDVAVSDESGAPIPGLNPSAWMSLRAEDGKNTRDRCTSNVATFTAGNLFVRPEVDLNVYHVLALNSDATINVVDPRFGFGGTQLLAQIELPAPGEDWTFSADGELLFVSIPSKDQVVVIDTATWKIRRSISVGPTPTRLVLGRDLWVVTKSGVAMLDGSKVLQQFAVPEARDIIVAADFAVAIGKEVRVVPASRRPLGLSGITTGAKTHSAFL